MMALQVCSRCRKRRIRCDRESPACKNCRLADVKCMFWDESLGEEIPSAYLHSLQQKVASLQLEIQRLTDHGNTSSNTTTSDLDTTPFSRKSYHLEIADLDELPSPTRTAYLGPGTSARVIQGILKNTTKWKIANKVQLPRLLALDAPALQTRFPEHRVTASFSLSVDTRKLDLYTLVPPSTQRAIIEHYFKVVAPEFPLLSSECQAICLAHENPLKWISSNKDQPGASALIMVFAVSTALLTRDIDPNLSGIASRSRADVQRLSSEHTTPAQALGASSWTCTALCALALCELILPTDGQIWDLLGRAISTLEDLKEACLVSPMTLDADFRRLERVVLELESMTMLHLQRPSLFCETQILLHLEENSTHDNPKDDLVLGNCLRNILRALSASVPSELFLEALIPISLQVPTFSSDISFASASLYIALHPLFTQLDFYPGPGTLGAPSHRMVHVITTSALVIIDHFTQLNEKHLVISISLAAERVLLAGAVWAAGLLHQKRFPGAGPYPVHATSVAIALTPVMKVSSLLASFAARWKAGAALTTAWEVVIDSLWQVV